MAQEFTDLIRIEVRGEAAKTTLRELRELFLAVQTQAAETGASVDAAMGRLVTPLQEIARNTRTTVTELTALRQALAGIGTVAAAPQAAAQSVRQIGISARYSWQQLGAMQTGGPWSAATARGYQAYGMMPPYQPEWTAVATAAQQRLAAPVVAPTAARDIEQVTRATDDYSKATDRADRTTTRFSGSFRRHVVWFAQGTVIYYAISAAIQTVTDNVGGAIDSLVAYDVALARMRFITGESTAELASLAGQVQDVSAAFGQLPTDVLPGLVAITQATKDYNEQLALSRDAARWAFMSGQEYADGLDQLVAIERVWNLEFSEGQRILDAVATSYRVAMVPMDEMMSTLEKGGRIAESVGMDLEEYTAMIASMGEYANLSAAQVTTLMESLAARPFRSEIGPRFQREFGFLNIPLYEPGTAQTQRREIVDIINDIAQHWDELSATQRQSIAEIMAGQRYAAEFLAFMEAWRHIPDYVDEYNDNLGESNRLLGEHFNTIEGRTEIARASWALFREEIILTAQEILNVSENLMVISTILDVLARRARVARGEPEEPLTFEEQLRRRLELAQEALAEVRGERGVLPMVTRRIRGFEGIISATQPEQYMQDVIDSIQRQLAEVLPRGVPRDLMGEYKAALQETAQTQRELFSEEEAHLQRLAELRRGEYIVDVDAWVAGLGQASGILDMTEFTVAQINQMKLESIALVWEEYEATIAALEALQGAELTWQQERAIREAIVDSRLQELVLIRAANGELVTAIGLESAYLQELSRATDVERERFNIQRLGRVQPEQFGQLQQLAWQWQSYLQTLPGYDEEARQFFVVLADNVARPIVTTSTALRYAIEDLTEVEKRQLEGMWNIPAGVTAYVPITSLFYQREAGGGPPGAGAMAGPPVGIDTGPVNRAVIDLETDMDSTGLATTTLGSRLNELATTVSSVTSRLLMAIEQELQVSLLTPARAAEMERIMSTPWSETWTQMTTPYTPMTETMRTETERAFAQPWNLQQALQSIQATPVKANITLTSNLYMDAQLLARTVQQVLGTDLSQESRAYGARAGGNAPTVMM